MRRGQTMSCRSNMGRWFGTPPTHRSQRHWTLTGFLFSPLGQTMARTLYACSLERRYGASFTTRASLAEARYSLPASSRQCMALSRVSGSTVGTTAHVGRTWRDSYASCKRSASLWTPSPSTCSALCAPLASSRQPEPIPRLAKCPRRRRPRCGAASRLWGFSLPCAYNESLSFPSSATATETSSCTNGGSAVRLARRRASGLATRCRVMRGLNAVHLRRERH
mmetsp:Transcript_67997/g.159966  ORF Transcript_67997/g.159966 Transcript_67997/m.159966 type:complete len:223 (+) Transcript_67997:424-1092(+)